METAMENQKQSEALILEILKWVIYIDRVIKMMNCAVDYDDLILQYVFDVGIRESAYISLNYEFLFAVPWKYREHSALCTLVKRFDRNLIVFFYAW